jgi:phosphoenolpyruvate synthase/pyruvate phosphate dikinase
MRGTIVAFKEEGIWVPEVFATMAEAYWKFLNRNDLIKKLHSLLAAESSNDVARSLTDLV